MNNLYNQDNFNRIDNQTVISHTTDFIIQMRNLNNSNRHHLHPLISIDKILKRILTELEYEIVIKGTTPLVPILWVRDIVPRIINVRRQRPYHIGTYYAFIDIFIERIRTYNISELNYVYNEISQMNLLRGG
jgi:hypothetical protein